MSAELLQYRLADRVATATMNRPEKRNALSRELVDALSAALLRAETDGARVLILAGNGPAFSAGADLAALQRLQGATFEENLEDSRALAGLFRLMYAAPYPIVAAVHGHAIAGGAGVVAAADYAVAAPEARLGFTEVRIGFVPAIVTTFVLRKLREGDARDLLLSGRLIDGTQAAEMGLVNETAPPDEVHARALHWARIVADGTSRQSVARTRRMISELRLLAAEEALESAAVWNAEARGTEDCRAGVAAFLRGEDPPWKSNPRTSEA